MSDEAKSGGGKEEAPKVKPGSAQDDLGRLNPSSPAETGTTPGSNGKPIDGEGPEANGAGAKI